MLHTIHEKNEQEMRLMNTAMFWDLCPHLTPELALYRTNFNGSIRTVQTVMKMVLICSKILLVLFNKLISHALVIWHICILTCRQLHANSVLIQCFIAVPGLTTNLNNTLL